MVANNATQGLLTGIEFKHIKIYTYIIHPQTVKRDIPNYENR